MPTKQEVVASLAAVNSVDAGVASEFVDEQVDENDHHLLETRAPLAAVGYWMAAKSRHMAKFPETDLIPSGSQGMTVLQDIKEQLKEQGARLEVVENRLNKIERYSLQGSIDACQNFIINAVKERISGWPNQVAPLSGPSPASPKLSPDEFAQKIDKIAHSTHPEVEMDFVINKRSPYW